MATSIPDVRAEITIPADGTISRRLFEDERLRLVAFGFDAGQELTEHTASAEVVVQVLSGRITLRADGRDHVLVPGSWLHLAPREAHALVADEPSVVVLTMIGPTRG